MTDKLPDPRDIANEIERLKKSFLLYAEGSQQMADGMKTVVYKVFEIEARVAALERNWGGEGFGPVVLK